ncbi:MAG: Type pantothenate kinase [Verrucomicrobiota bacterium]|jgi:type III pantothenate kinase
MLLTVDVGNSQIHGGVFTGDTLALQFRKTTQPIGSSDELGVFLRSVLRENDLDPARVERVAICSVVPPVAYPLRAACVKYFNCEPFILQAGVKTGLKIRYRNPAEVGADRVACAIGAAQRQPGKNLLVVDCGTATTVEVITQTGDYLGGAIMPGVGISSEILASRTAKLPRVEIARPENALGRSTAESIQSGLYHGHVGAIRNLTSALVVECFNGERPHVIGTGGFTRMFEAEELFDEIVPELVLFGLKHAEQLNQEPGK